MSQNVYKAHLQNYIPTNSNKNDYTKKILDANVNIFQTDDTLKGLESGDIFKCLESGKNIINGDYLLTTKTGELQNITPHQRCVAYTAAYGYRHYHRLEFIINEFFKEKANNCLVLK